ncbi:MAG: hypothetical protein V1790_09540 [Planctomycetota bacterium]
MSKTQVHPARSGDRVFDLARSLKAKNPDAVNPDDLQRPVHEWFITSGNASGESWADTWSQFVYCWPRVRYAKGTGPLAGALSRAQAAPLENYDEARLNVLAALCRELQHAVGDAPFFLSCRSVAELLDIDRMRACRWLNLLVHDNVLAVATPGTTRRATRYVFLKNQENE